MNCDHGEAYEDSDGNCSVCQMEAAEARYESETDR